MRYRSSDEIDTQRIALFAKKILGDATALEKGFFLSDVKAIELLSERILPTLEKNKADKLTLLVKQLRADADAEDFKSAHKTAEQLISIFGIQSVSQSKRVTIHK